jgi:asparagine synthetase B (glutamine-hydrolysing)
MNEAPAARYARLLRFPSLSRWLQMRVQEEAVGGYALRAPFFDDDFLRFASTLPPLSLMQGGFLRGLMRDAMRGLVPEGLRLRETKGTFFFFTEQTIAAAGGLDILSGLADVRMLAALDLVNRNSFRAFFDGFRGVPHLDATYYELWHVLSIEAFLRQHSAEGHVEAR